MKLAIVSPGYRADGDGPTTGNDVTALRWRDLISRLGHQVEMLGEYSDEPVDALLALHARKSAGSIARFAELYPGRGLLVALTGTDLYVDFPESEEVWDSLHAATHVIALQTGALDVLNPTIRAKTTIIHQSAKPIVPPLEKAAHRFQASLVANLREVKDPLLAAEAAAIVPESSQVHVLHAGAAVDEALAERAREASNGQSRYEWIGPLTHEESRLLIARSHVMLLTSRHEGGANVLSEALAIGIPILAAASPGVTGLLGSSYPGLFPVGDAEALAELLLRAEHDEVFYRRLELAGARLAPLVTPSWELRAWHQLLSSFE